LDRYQKIAVGLDLDGDGKRLSAGGQRAAQQARDLASRSGASVTFLHSTFRESAEEQLAGGDDAKLGRAVREALEALSREFTETTTPPSLHITTEPAWLELTRWAVQGRADLIIVGKRRRTVDDGRQIGSSALELVRKCPVPVWVVHPDHEPGDGCVLAATDLTAVGDRASQIAQYVADLYGSQLHLLHAYQRPMSEQLSSGIATREGTPEERMRKREADLRRHMLAAISQRPSGVHVHVGCDSPSRAIEAALQALDPNLLVMGTLSRTGLPGLLMGNSAERVLPRVKCSLLTIKPEDFVSPID
jgi:universal stress protein E